MKKIQSNNESFMARTASFSTHASRTGINLLGWGDAELLDHEQQRQAILAAKKPLDQELEALNMEFKGALPYKVFQEKVARRQEVRAKVTELLALLAALPKKAKGPDMGECIIGILRERMTKPQWAAVIKEAHERFREANGYSYEGSEYK